jgi:hypothetical protein
MPPLLTLPAFAHHTSAQHAIAVQSAKEQTRDGKAKAKDKVCVVCLMLHLCYSICIRMLCSPKMLHQCYAGFQARLHMSFIVWLACEGCA